MHSFLDQKTMTSITSIMLLLLFIIMIDLSLRMRMWIVVDSIIPTIIIIVVVVDLRGFIIFILRFNFKHLSLL